MNATEMIQKYISKETSFTVDYYHMEEITKAVYGKGIEVIESPNDTTHEFSVKPKVEEWDQERVEKAIKNGYLEAYAYGCILNDLCKKNIIEPGKYYIRVSW